MQENKRDRVTYSKPLLQSYDNYVPKHLYEVITADETWVHHYEPEVKAKSRAWVPKGGNLPQIAERSLSQKKVLYTLSFNSSGITLQKPCEEEKSIIGKYFRESVFAEVNSFYERKNKHWLAWYQTSS